VAGKDTENEAMREQLEKREAGVAELLEFYARVEEVYVSASRASEEGYTVTTSNSTNLSNLGRYANLG